MKTKTAVDIKTISCTPTTEEFENFLYYKFKEKIEQLGCDDHVFAFYEEDICIADVHKLDMLELKNVIPVVQCDGEDGYDTQQDLEHIFIECIPEWMENPYNS
jgi:hypothetical protein